MLSPVFKENVVIWMNSHIRLRSGVLELCAHVNIARAYQKHRELAPMKLMMSTQNGSPSRKRHWRRYVRVH